MQPKPETQPCAPAVATAGDLCSHCTHAADCSLRAHTDQPVYECSEYDDGDPALQQRPVRLRAVAQETEDRLAEPPGLEGLCINCDHRHDCTLPRPAGGVWHCEEYR
jgi:hypothetical protein